ncbi:hypothetical protein FOMPIDRAFT_1109667 [Fomitopsis schrenkii]|uniref:Transcription factor TFIIB cyclin-like domain-containing protein n=1 Tax=Fomitopsis schrenkii TaxID=2126942 RepID=S8EQ91_FOMSC|nr:hypothetical protein FOMPIDRAFT_1109667 [Fomitopsis schrenkii]
MSRDKCAECGGRTEWDENVGSAICIQCGTLADPTQSVLTTHLDFPTNGTSGPWTTNTTLSLKGRKGWTLAGQSQEASLTRNRAAIHSFIQALAVRVSARGAAERAQTLFDQAMSRDKFRWGRKSKRMAGAALAIALRESKKSDALRDIAFILEETPETLGRSFSSLARVLDLKVTPTDPTVHLSALHSHIISMLQVSPHAFPDGLKAALQSLLPRMMSIMRTADSLCALISRSDGLAKLPTPSTACAVLMLAVEAELQKQVPHTGVFAQILGARYEAAKATVMQRYKLIYDLVEGWIREVPWLDAHERKKGKEGRSVIAKRVVVARGLKDVLQFQEEIWVKKLEAQAEPLLRLDLELAADTEENQDGEDDADADGHTSSTSPTLTKQELVMSRPVHKSYKSSHERAVARASRFLLDPLRQASSAGSGAQSMPLRLRKPSGRADLDLLSHILTADVAHLPHVFANAPSRLQILAARAPAADIPDEELFADGELDGLIRSAEEAGQLQIALGWDGEGEEEAPLKRSRQKRKRALEDESQGSSKGTKRINMDALAQLLNPDMDLGVVYGSSETMVSGGDGEIVEEWRPMSPGGGGCDDDWYE